jgi:hypothetical protein
MREEEGDCRVSDIENSCGAPINFRDLTPYLTSDLPPLQL